MPAKTDSNSIEVLISKVLIDLNINHDELFLINNMLKEYENMTKKEKKKIEELTSSSKILVFL